MDFDVPIQTAVHVVISLIAIVSGAVVSYGFLAAKRLDLLDGGVPGHHRADERDWFHLLPD